MNKHLEQFMRGLTRKQAAYILGVTPAAISLWIKEEPGPLALKAMYFFSLLSEEHQSLARLCACVACPNKGGKVYQ